jgi:exodeoxyribonuclease X
VILERKRFAETTFAVVDVETTGVDPQLDRVVEVACVVLRGGARVETFSTLVDPGRAIPATASAVHHLTDAHVRGAPRLGEVAERLRALTRDAVIVAHNAAFDLRFLPFLADRPWLCSMRFARAVMPDAPNHKNQVLRYHLGIDDPALETASAHRALGDAIVTSRVFTICVERYLATGGTDDVPAAVAEVMRPRPLPALTFGRHRGKPIVDVPRDYLEWLAREGDLGSPDVALTVRGELARRGGGRPATPTQQHVRRRMS